MKYKCSHCNEVFEQSTAPKACPLCKGEGKARYPKRLPTKRLTNKQKRQVSCITPEALKAWKEDRALDPTPLTREKVQAMAKRIADNGLRLRKGSTFCNTPQELHDAGVIDDAQLAALKQDDAENATLRQLGPFTLDGKP